MGGGDPVVRRAKRLKAREEWIGWDPRARNRHHRLAAVLTITALAILMGRQRPADFVRLAQQLNARQRAALGYYRPLGKRPGSRPAAACSTRCSAGSSPLPSLPCSTTGYRPSTASCPRPSPSTARAVTDRLAQIVSLVAQETGATVAVALVLAVAKEHEVPAARALLAKTDLTDGLVSFDVGHANHDTARTLFAAGGEYLFQLKGNAAAAAHALKDTALFYRTTATTAAPNTAS